MNDAWYAGQQLFDNLGAVARESERKIRRSSWPGLEMALEDNRKAAENSYGGCFIYS